MKTKIVIFNFILSVIAVVTFFSCDIPVGLGPKLDIEGPVVTIISPAQRQSVSKEFELTGTVYDATGVEKIEIKAEKSNKEFAKQWRYLNDVWEIYDTADGNTWAWQPFPAAELNGSIQSAVWKIPVSMEIIGQVVDEGEYTFSVQAWDKGGFSDDNSYKAVVLFVDLNPPKVDISYPYLYRGNNALTDPDSPLIELHEIPDDDDDGLKIRQNPSYLGKFLTQEFDLKWQIEDLNDVWSIDLRFYKHDAVIDNNPDTPLPDDYYYKFSQNLPPPPPDATPADYITPNGSVIVPDLYGTPLGTYDQEGELKAQITEKTTIKVVAVCYDAAGNPNQEKTLGYFIYWPKANNPWIVFSEGMEEVADYYGKTVTTEIEPVIFTVFPGRYIKVTAYQAHGVERVEYEIWKCDTTGDTLHEIDYTLEPEPPGKTPVLNTPNSGMYSNIFALQIDVPWFTGYYVVKAKAFTSKGKSSEEYEMLFRVNDITFPDFPTSPLPAASDPLFKAVQDNKITIRGIVSDATEIETLCLVWINPDSEGYAAMSQLAYFREKDYEGWKRILNFPGPGNTITETIQSPGNYPNRLWKLNVTPHDPPIDLDNNRRLFDYSQEIDLDILNIGMGKNPLKSQVFLLRAQNPGGQCTIITYAPQGDTKLPEISISSVYAKGVSYPTNEYAVIPQFANNDVIIINGTWVEDSVEELSIDTYFKPNFEIEVNNQSIPLSALTITKDPGEKTKGTFIITTSARTTTTPGDGQIPLERLKDTLAISVKTKDIGGNIADAQSSWLIQSDKLRLMRISSELDDDVYRVPEVIEIFLEFSKPVKLVREGITPELILSSAAGNTARALYKAGQSDYNSRQYFVYTVAAGQDTTPEYLNVKGLYYNGVEYTTSSLFNVANYPFAWYRGAGPEREEVRLTMNTGRDGSVLQTDTSGSYYVRTLPTSTTPGNSDYQFTLYSAKHIVIDTAAPTVSAIKADNEPKWYNAGDLSITVNFNEPVMIGATLPQLNLSVGSATRQTSSIPADVRVNGTSVTFRYTIQSGDTSNGNQIVVTGHTGIITDIAGNPLASTGISGHTLTGTGGRTLTDIYIETQKPGTPTVRVLTAANTTSIVTNNVNGTPHQGLSKDNPYRSLSNLYEPKLWLAIEGDRSPGSTATYNYKYDSIEYSINNGTSWVKAGNTTNAPVELSQTATYNIIARQIDKAGNVTEVADYSPAVSFTWDPDKLVSRVSSADANGTYTHVPLLNPQRNVITISVYFRKNIYFTAGTASITIDAKRGGNNITLTTPLGYNTAINKLDFIYTVQNGDTTNGLNLNVVSSNITGLTAWDADAGDTARVNVSALLSLPTFDTSKSFVITTGDLTRSNIAFAGNSGTQGNDNYHGIMTNSDGSYWTTLRITFNRAISRGTGDITITQSATDYRMPAVMTEAQYSRLKSNTNINISGVIDTYYIKGTNGYDNTVGASDTSNKYVLQYNFDPRSGVTTDNTGFQGNTAIPSGVFTDFRNAEAIKVNVNASVVTITNNAGQSTGTLDTISIRLSGSNALQVPGATYTVNLPIGIVIDTLGNKSEPEDINITPSGVAKPFVRIKKTQDTISVNANPSIYQPRLVATQPFLANARMDCRTPGSNITYSANEGRTTVLMRNPGTTGDNNNWRYDVAAPNNSNTNNNNAFANGKNNNNDPNATRPTNATATPYNNSTQITLGNNADGNSPDITNVQGYQWWVRAVASVSGSPNSVETEEMAYRTVISYQVRNGNGVLTGTAANGRSIFAAGDQAWIRGGDAIGSSSIPGFPFTWEDDWSNNAAALKDKRAGIRLMSLVAVNNNTQGMNNSVWRFVTWDMNTTAYVDFIRGRDLTVAAGGTAEDTVAYTASTQESAWQYGPKRWAYQADGWTAFKAFYPIYAGKHRWCDTGYQWGTTGPHQAINFSGTFMARTDLTANDPATYNRWPGLNKQ
jgi:hypothetical protein